MDPPDLSLCVAVWQVTPEPNVMSLARGIEKAAGGLDVELVVVLNGVAASELALPEVARLVHFDCNRGVPVAWNAAAAAARGRSLCFVNDDVLLGRDALKSLHDTLMSLNDAGVVGPVGTYWDIERAEHLRYLSDGHFSPGTARRCDVVSGFLFATPSGLFEQLGGIDEAFTPCGFEEVDYCTAVRRLAGLSCYAVTGVNVRHDFNVSAWRPWKRIAFDGRRESLARIHRRNRKYFRAKWAASLSSGGRPVIC